MKLPVLLMLLSLVAPLAACTGAGPPDGGSPGGAAASSGVTEPADTRAAALGSLPKDEGLLFALQADSGSLKAAGSTDFAYTLTLDHAARQTTWFTDRPARDGGTVSTEALVSGWASLGFEKVPPNAVLTAAGREADDALIVELGVPSYDHDERTMSVPVQVIGRTANDGIAGSFGAASLFIDNATMSSGCGYTGAVDYFPASVTPIDYIPADGRSARKDEYAALYAVLGDRFGSDAETFRLPTIDAPGPLLQALVCAYDGVDPAADTDPICVIGSLQLFAQDAIVPGYVLANGQQIPISTHPSLFGYTSNRFGGDGITTFGIPSVPSPPGTSQQVCASNVALWIGTPAGGWCYISEVGYWAAVGEPGNWSPTGTLDRGGYLVPVLQHTQLFALIGTEYGGDGKAMFSLPPADVAGPGLPPTVCVNGAFPRHS